MESSEVQITSGRVADGQRLAFLPQQFGRRFMQGEMLVYDWARRLSARYEGGAWDYFTLSNGGFFVAPRMESPVAVTWAGNGYEGEMSAEAFGIVVTLFALCHLSEISGEDLHAEKFHLLREFAAWHAEQGEIFAAID